MTGRAVERGRIGDAAAPAAGETFREVARLAGATVEEIVSSATPDAALQVQDHDEWVVVLAGAAALEVEGREDPAGVAGGAGVVGRVELRPGDWILLPAGTPHRVVHTDPGTRWLAVHGIGSPEVP